MTKWVVVRERLISPPSELHPEGEWAHCEISQPMIRWRAQSLRDRLNRRLGANEEKVVYTLIKYAAMVPLPERLEAAE